MTAKKAATKRAPRKASPKKKITASIKLMGKSYNAIGASVSEALSKLNVGRNAKGFAVLSMGDGSRNIIKILPRTNVARLFSLSPTMREIALKNTSLLFDL